MSSCLEQLREFIIPNTNTTWGALDRVTLASYTSTSYFRPDVGGALFPWSYTILFLIIHLPVVIIRVARFDVVQWFCIGSAMLAVYLTIQEYVSTQLAPSKVLVWTPLLLVIDAGAMLQVFFLVIEGRVVKVGERSILMEPDEVPKTDVLPQSEPLTKTFKKWWQFLWKTFKSTDGTLASTRLGLLPGGQQRRNCGVLRTDGCEVSAAAEMEAGGQAEQETPSAWPAIFAAAISAVLFLTIFISQIYGVQAAWKMHQSGKPPVTTYCSPSFQPFGVAVMDGNCNVYPIQKRDLQGIGCIDVEGDWQQGWLLGTAIGVSICLVLEIIDLFILSLVNSNMRFAKAQWIKMKRPWTTMIWGVVVLGVTLFYGIEYAQGLPPRFTERVLIVADVGKLLGFDARLSSAGLRGAVLAWTDGLFQSWGKAYFGVPLPSHS